MDRHECSAALKAARYGAAVVQLEQKRLARSEKDVSTSAEAKAYVSSLSTWGAGIDEETREIAEDWTLCSEEKLTIERKEKFATYIDVVKSKSLSLEGDIDSKFAVKKKLRTN